MSYVLRSERHLVAFKSAHTNLTETMFATDVMKLSIKLKTQTPERAPYKLPTNLAAWAIYNGTLFEGTLTSAGKVIFHVPCW